MANCHRAMSMVSTRRPPWVVNWTLGARPGARERAGDPAGKDERPEMSADSRTDGSGGHQPSPGDLPRLDAEEQGTGAFDPRVEVSELVGQLLDGFGRPEDHDA